MAVYAFVGYFVFCDIFYTDFSINNIENGFVCDLSFCMRQVLLVLALNGAEHIIRVSVHPLVLAVGSDIFVRVGIYAHIFGKASINDTSIFINKIKGKIL